MTDPIDQLRAENEALSKRVAELEKTFITRIEMLIAQRDALRTKAVKALEKAATLNTGQDCPSENMEVVVAAMNALTALRGDNAGERK